MYISRVGVQYYFCVRLSLSLYNYTGFWKGFSLLERERERERDCT